LEAAALTVVPLDSARLGAAFVKSSNDMTLPLLGAAAGWPPPVKSSNETTAT
jgi:hypothetical protein